MNKWIRFGLFTILAAIQIYITISIITSKEEVLEHGTLYKFDTAPVDPNDPFRGKYVTLRYRNRVVPVNQSDEWNYGEPVYVQIKKDEKDVAQLIYGTKEPVDNNNDFFKATFASRLNDDSVTIEYPFKRFYLEESKAPVAESIYRKNMWDTSSETFAVVKILHGESVLEDILIDNRSLRDLVIEAQNTKTPSSE